MKIEIETETPKEAALLSELVHLTQDQRKLIRLALREYVVNFSRNTPGPEEDPFLVQTGIELIMWKEYMNILRKFGMKVGEDSGNPSYFSIAPKDGETPEEFAERTNTRSWLEVDDSEET